MKPPNKFGLLDELEKIALEEAVGCPVFAAYLNYPPRPPIKGTDGLPFNPQFLADAEARLDDVDLRLEPMDQCGIQYAVVSLISPGIEGVSDASTATYSSGEFCLWVDFHSDPILGSLLVSNQTSLLSKMV